MIDNNLTHLKVSGGRLTAESIAGYIRAFTTGTYIISVNKNPDVDFDLRFLIGDYNTRTDLALNETHLGNRALWTGDPRDADDGFIPWYWPHLDGVAKRRKEQIAFVHERLDEAGVLVSRIQRRCNRFPIPPCERTHFPQMPESGRWR